MALRSSHFTGSENHRRAPLLTTGSMSSANLIPRLRTGSAMPFLISFKNFRITKDRHLPAKKLNGWFQRRPKTDAVGRQICIVTNVIT